MPTDTGEQIIVRQTCYCCSKALGRKWGDLVWKLLLLGEVGGNKLTKGLKWPGKLRK